MGGRLLEIPVTTMPLFRVPIHMTYLMYLSKISERLMFFYLKCALALCRLTKTAPNFLIHLNTLRIFLGPIWSPEMDFFPGMEISSDKKLMIFKKVIDIIERNFTIVTLEEYAKEIWAKHDRGRMVEKEISHKY